MSLEDTEERIAGHYGWSGLMKRIEQEIRHHGIDPQQVTVDQLAPVDNYHWHRLAGTLALARLAAITDADRVLDVGGGIGGPARQLAHRFGSQVTVLDLTAEYCAVGESSPPGHVSLTVSPSSVGTRLPCRFPTVASTWCGPSTP